MRQVSFDDTEIAFRSRSNADLRRSYFLFSLIKRPSWVDLGSWLAKTSLRLNLPVKGMIRKTIFAQFCGGENIEQCSRTIETLAKFNIGTILDYSVEGKEEQAVFEHTCQEICATVQRAARDKAIPFSVFKVTGIASQEILEQVSSARPLSDQQKIEWAAAEERVARICGLAEKLHVPIFIDAEESWIQQAIDQLALTMMRRHNREACIVYNTYQLYRKDRFSALQRDAEACKAEGVFIGAKLVRGAYMEKERERATRLGYPSPIHDTKEDTDRDYDRALHYCIQNHAHVSICAGTHNESSSLLLTRLMEEHNIPKSDKRFYFSQLLGMSDHISYNLSNQGYCVAKYVPYGPIRDVLPYLIRRARENTSVKGQTGRELSLILKERERRKSIRNA